MPVIHHPVALGTNAKFGIASIHCGLSTAGCLNPYARGDVLAIQTKPIESSAMSSERIFNSLANLAPLAVVNYSCHFFFSYAAFVTVITMRPVFPHVK